MRRSARRSSVSRGDVAIVTAGIMMAAAVGVVTYQKVGPYGDGPINVGLYRAEDPDTGAQFVYRKLRMQDGELRYLFDDATRSLREVRTVRRGQPDTVRAVTRPTVAPVHTITRDAANGGLKIGFSLRGNGVVDAWEYRDAKGQIQRIEVSRRQNGVIDRWEYYENNQLARVEEDEDRNGRIDRWLTFDAGILVKEARDRDGDGRPDPPGR